MLEEMSNDFCETERKTEIQKVNRIYEVKNHSKSSRFVIFNVLSNFTVQFNESNINLIKNLNKISNYRNR